MFVVDKRGELILIFVHSQPGRHLGEKCINLISVAEIGLKSPVLILEIVVTAVPWMRKCTMQIIYYFL